MRPLRVLAVPCQDGFGPAALLSHAIRELVRRRPDCAVTIDSTRTVAGGESYCARLFEGVPQVTVRPRGNPLWLAKPGGVTCVASTLAHMADYAAWSDAYSPDGAFDLVFEYGVPAVARWAARAGVRCVSLFDHAWSITLEAMAREQRTEHPALGATLDAIRRDEAATREMFLLPRFVAPPPYPEYWRETAGHVTELPGVLGGRFLWSRGEARRFLGLRDPIPTVLVQAGDTPAWDPVLPKLVRQLAAADRDLPANVLIHVPARLPMPRLERNRYRRLRRVRMPRGSFQAVLAAVDVIVGRAGGGTVNDAVACRVPLVCVDEPGQPQVHAILAACVTRGLTRAVRWPEFARDPAGGVLDAVARPPCAASRAIGCGAESAVVDSIL